MLTLYIYRGKKSYIFHFYRTTIRLHVTTNYNKDESVNITYVLYCIVFNKRLRIVR
jgi:hypothetical protein